MFISSLNTTLSPCLSTPWTQPCLHVIPLLEQNPVSMCIFSLNTTLSLCLSTPWNQPCLHVYLLLETNLACLYPEKDTEMNLTLNPEKMDAGQNKYLYLWYWEHPIVYKPLCVTLNAYFKGTVSVSDPPYKENTSDLQGYPWNLNLINYLEEMVDLNRVSL